MPTEYMEVQNKILMKYFLTIFFTLFIAFSCTKKEKPKQTIVAGAPFEIGKSTGKLDYQDINLLKNPFQNLSYTQEIQGEAIAWKSDGKDFFTVSENPSNVLSFTPAIDLLFYQRK